MTDAQTPLEAQVEPLIEEATLVAAPADRVWPLVSDPRLMSRWSPQVMRVIRRSGDGTSVGSRFLNLNRSGLLMWPTRSQVVECDPGRRYAWRIRDNRAIWSFELAEHAAGVRLTHRRECPDGLTERALRLETRFMGGVPEFQDSLRQGMRRTLAAIKAAAELPG